MLDLWEYYSQHWNEIIGGMGLTINSGTSVYRRFEVFNAAGDRLTDSNFSSTFFLRSTVSYDVGG